MSKCKSGRIVQPVSSVVHFVLVALHYLAKVPEEIHHGRSIEYPYLAPGQKPLTMGGRCTDSFRLIGLYHL